MKKIKLGLYGIELTTSIADSEASGEITMDLLTDLQEQHREAVFEICEWLDIKAVWSG